MTDNLMADLFPTFARDLLDDAAWGGEVPAAYRDPDDPVRVDVFAAVIGSRWELREPRGNALDTVTLIAVDAANGELVFQTTDWGGVEDPTTAERPSRRGVDDGEPPVMVRERRNSFALEPDDFERYYRPAADGELAETVMAAESPVARLEKLLAAFEVN